MEPVLIAAVAATAAGLLSLFRSLFDSLRTSRVAKQNTVITIEHPDGSSVVIRTKRSLGEVSIEALEAAVHEATQKNEELAATVFEAVQKNEELAAASVHEATQKRKKKQP